MKSKSRIDDKLLERMRKAVESGLMNKSDKCHKIDTGYPIEIVKLCNGYGVRATGISDSSIWLRVYESGLGDTPRSFLNACDAAGAYTKTAWELLGRQSGITVAQMITHFNIRGSIRPLLRTNEISREDAEAMAALLREWAVVREQITDEECFVMNQLNFLRKSRRKKNNEQEPGCFDGLCIDRQLANILPNVRDAAW